MHSLRFLKPDGGGLEKQRLETSSNNRKTGQTSNNGNTSNNKNVIVRIAKIVMMVMM